jgi:GPH family glycoside/pentoside/hexuronide:cation symporter/probable glucitol transport protein GutA
MTIKERDSQIRVKGGVIARREYRAYALGGFGENIIYWYISGYLMLFYTDILLVPSSAVGVMFLITRLFDALDDFAMGAVIDRTRTKRGKMRPYLFIAPIPLAITSTLLFTAPQLSVTGRIVYMYVTYIVWSIFYTISDVPYTSLVSVLSPLAEERTNLISYSKLLASLCASIPPVLISLLSLLKDRGAAGLLAKDNARIYFSIAVFFALIMVCCMYTCYSGTKERIVQSDEKPTFRDCFRYLFANKPLMLVMLTNLLMFPRSIQATVQIYVATYLMGGAQWVFFLGIPMAAATLVTMAFTPKIVSKFGPWQTYVGSLVVYMIPFTILYFIGYQNLPMIVIFSFLYIVTTGPQSIVPSILIADSVDAMELKTGQRAEGMSFAVQTFMGKAIAAFQSLATGLMLAWFGYVQPKNIGGVLTEQVQSAAAKQGIWAMYTIIPSLGCIFCIIPLLFYRLRGDNLKEMREQLAVKRAERAEHQENETEAEKHDGGNL